MLTNAAGIMDTGTTLLPIASGELIQSISVTEFAYLHV